MKILLVDNGTLHLEKIKRSFAGHIIEVQRYSPDLYFHHQDKDLIILSGGGGEGQEIHNKYSGNRLWYENEMQLVQSTSKPILGICMGFEVIAAAYGSNVTAMPKNIEEFAASQPTKIGKTEFGREYLWQFEAHNWRVQDVSSKHFEVLAQSPTGIEIIRHKTRSIIATQFHPEMPDGTLGVRDMSRLMFSIG